jgi:KUP system potassium uptake protein
MSDPSASTDSVPPASHAGGHHGVDPNPRGKRLAILTLTALGVVYGDIGTSPLYALRACFKPEYGIAPTPENVYGVLSLILWALILVVSVKYIAAKAGCSRCSPCSSGRAISATAPS